MKNKRKLLIPTTQETREYFETCLRLNKTHCPYGGKRETSGYCPFYFAGGGCRCCSTFDSEEANIVRAWTTAIAVSGFSSGRRSPDIFPPGYGTRAQGGQDANQH